MNRFKKSFRQVLESIPGYVYILRLDSAWCRGWKTSDAAAPTKFGMCRYNYKKEKESGISPRFTAAHAVYARAKSIEQNHWQKLYVHAHTQFLMDAAALELKLKERYKKFHLRGEWFNLTPRQVQNAERFLFREGKRYE